MHRQQQRQQTAGQDDPLVLAWLTARAERVQHRGGELAPTTKGGSAEPGRSGARSKVREQRGDGTGFGRAAGCLEGRGGVLEGSRQVDVPCNGTEKGLRAGVSFNSKRCDGSGQVVVSRPQPKRQCMASLVPASRAARAMWMEREERRKETAGASELPTLVEMMRRNKRRSSTMNREVGEEGERMESAGLNGPKDAHGSVEEEKS